MGAGAAIFVLLGDWWKCIGVAEKSLGTGTNNLAAAHGLLLAAKLLKAFVQFEISCTFSARTAFQLGSIMAWFDGSPPGESYPACASAPGPCRFHSEPVAWNARQ